MLQSLIIVKMNFIFSVFYLHFRSIGLAIARRLGQDGAKVMVSSRKEVNVENTVKQLQAENLQVDGMVCHVGKAADRTALIEKVTPFELVYV